MEPYLLPQGQSVPGIQTDLRFCEIVCVSLGVGCKRCIKSNYEAKLFKAILFRKFIAGIIKTILASLAWPCDGWRFNLRFALNKK